jgi:hypothetical protein
LDEFEPVQARCQLTRDCWVAGEELVAIRSLTGRQQAAILFDRSCDGRIVETQIGFVA